MVEVPLSWSVSNLLVSQLVTNPVSNQQFSKALKISVGGLATNVSGNESVTSDLAIQAQVSQYTGQSADELPGEEVNHQSASKILDQLASHF